MTSAAATSHPSRRIVSMLLTLAMLLGALAWSRDALAEEPVAEATSPSPPVYSCLRDNLLVKSSLPCDYGRSTPGLLSEFKLVPGLGGNDSVLDATPEQRAALRRLEDQALLETALANGLPASEVPAIKSWGRTEALAQLWADVVAIMKKPPASYTDDEQHIADWLVSVFTKHEIEAAEGSILEYARWAGLDPAPVNYAIHRPPSELNVEQIRGTIDDFPQFYSDHGGACTYYPPAPLDDYTGRADSNCRTTCRSFDCSPIAPKYEQFFRWGVARANTDLINDPTWSMLSRSVINAIVTAAGIIGATAVGLITTAVLGVALAAVTAGSTAASIIGFLTPWTAAVITGTSAGTPALAIAGFSTLIGAAVAVAIVAIVVGTLKAIQLVEEGETLSTLASRIVAAHRSAPKLSEVAANPDATARLFTLFVSAALPDPFIRTCDNTTFVAAGASIPDQCLNPTPIPAPTDSDSWFYTEWDGGYRVTPTITLARAKVGTTQVSRVSGNWWVSAVTNAAGDTIEVQQLTTYYTDPSGTDSIARIVRMEDGSQQFLIAPEAGPDGRPLDPATCAAQGLCRVSPWLYYMGPDGKEYGARLGPPLHDATPLTLTIDPVDPQGVRYVTFEFSEPVVGTPVGTLTRNGEIVPQNPLVVVPADGRHWLLPVDGTAPDGEYTYTIHVGNVRDRFNHPVSGGDQSITWYHDALPRAAFDPVGSPSADPIDQLSILFSEPVENVDITDFRLLRDGVAVSMVGKVDVQQTGNRYTLRGLESVTSGTPAGTNYELVLLGSNDIHDRSGHSLDSVSLPFVVDAAPVATFTAIAPTAVLGAVTIRFSESVRQFNGTQLFLSRNGAAPVPVNEVVISRNATSDVYTVRGLGRYATAPGRYTLSLLPAGPHPSGQTITAILGTHDLPLTEPASIEFVIDNEGPEIVIAIPTLSHTIERNSVVNADYGCTDPSGVVACLGTTPDLRPLPTGTVGTHMLTVLAVDALGNESELSRSYEVVDTGVGPVTTTVPPRTTVPPATTTEPPATTQPPATTTVPPGTTTHPPVTMTVPPGTTTEPPVTTTDPPVTTTDPPVTTTEPPGTTTVLPVTTTVPPVTTTQPPVSTTTTIPGVGPATIPPTSQPPRPAPADIVGITPARLFDSRPGASTVDSTAIGRGRLEPGEVVEVTIAGRGSIPADARAAVLNVAVTSTDGPGYVVAYPCDGAMPSTSTVNFDRVGETIANTAVVALGEAGQVCLMAGGAATDVIIDATAYAPAASQYEPLRPVRLVDTRVRGGRQQAGSTLEISVAGRGGIPSSAGLVLLNITATQSAGAGFIAALPCDSDSAPTTSNLNFAADVAAVANLVLAPVSDDGTVCLTVDGASTHVVVDVSGYLPTGTTVRAAVLERLLDTRQSVPIDPGTTVIVDVAPGATSALLNVATLLAEGSGFVTVHPCTDSPPPTSSVNFEPDTVRANLVVTQLDAAGRACITAAGAPINVIVDLVAVVAAA